MPSVRIKRGTRAQLDAAATAASLKAGEPYLITDEDRFAMGLSTTTYEVYAKSSEVVAGSGDVVGPASAVPGYPVVFDGTTGKVVKQGLLSDINNERLIDGRPLQFLEGRPDGVNWTASTTPADNIWKSVCYGNGMFVAVSDSGVGNRVMTSRDGVTWTSRTSAADYSWASVCYGNGLFVAVSGGASTVMTSTDGVAWTLRTGVTGIGWKTVCFGLGKFVALGDNGTATCYLMTSTDGVTWVQGSNTSSFGALSVTFANGVFVAVGATGSGQAPMYSYDGLSWTSSTYPANSMWRSVCYGAGLFVAVASTGGANDQVMTSPDGIAWSLRTIPTSGSWYSLAFGNGVFVAPALTLGAVMKSVDGITWTYAAAQHPTNQWMGCCYGNGTFVAVSQTGTGNRASRSTGVKTVGGVSIFGSGDVPVGTGDVVGPASSVADQIALFNGATGKLLKASDVKTVGGESVLGSGNIAVYPAQIAKLTSTQASSSTTLGNVTQLVLAMEASATYEIDCFVTFQSAATTTGLRLGFTSPTSCLCFLETVVAVTLTDTSTQIRKIVAGSQSASVVGTGVSTINTNHGARISGVVVNGANAGNFQVQFASEVASSAVTLQIGSILKLRRIA